MKKLSVVLLMIILCFVTHVYAEESIETVFDIDTKNVLVRGSAGARERLTLWVVSHDAYTGVSGNVLDVPAQDIAYFGHTDADVYGGYAFTFQIDPVRPAGAYYAVVYSPKYGRLVKRFLFVDDRLLTDMMGALNSASAGDIPDLVDRDIFLVLGVPVDAVALYDSLDAAGQAEVNALWLNLRPVGGYSNATVAVTGLKSALSFHTLYSIDPHTAGYRAKAETEIEFLLTTTGNDPLWEKYTGLNSQNTLSAALKEKVFATWMQMLDTMDLTDLSKFQKELADSMVVNAINEATSWFGLVDPIQNAVTAGGFSEFLTAIHKTELEKRELSEVLKLVQNGKPAGGFPSIAAFTTAVNNAISAVPIKTGGTPKPDSSGLGGSGSSSGGNSGNVSIDKDLIGQEENNALFGDLQGYDWAVPAIQELVRLGIINGVGNGMFAPAENVTREQFVKMLVIAFQMQTEGLTVDFADCSPDDWSYPFIAAARSYGFVEGYDGIFDKGAPITRQDASVMIYRFISSPAQMDESLIFADENDISAYAKDAIAYLTGAEVLRGRGDSIFAPKAFATRAEAAQIIYNVLKVRGS